MSRLIILFLSLTSFFTATAQSSQTLMAEALKTEETPNELLALSKYKTIATLYPTTVKAYAKVSELYIRIGSRIANNNTQLKYFSTALTYAETALKISATNDDANVAMAMAIGKISLTKSPKEKISGAKKMKFYLDKALKTNPNNYLALHVLGKWNLELAAINGIERAAAKVMLGAIPQGSADLAIVYMEKSRNLRDNFALNSLELAKAYYIIGEKAKAKAQIAELLKYKLLTEDDAAIKMQARKYLQAWA